MSSCEAASARAGKDPHAPPGTPPGEHGKSDKTGFNGQPATVLGGALQDLAPANAVNRASGAEPTNQPSVNVLA